MALPSQLWLLEPKVIHKHTFYTLLFFEYSLGFTLHVLNLLTMSSVEASSNYKTHRRTPSSSSTLTYSPRDDDDGMV